MQTAQIGVYGLGTMGSALALNLAERGFRVAVTNLEPAAISNLLDRAGPLTANLLPEEDLGAFVASLETPRMVLFMIPSGPPLEAMIARIRPCLDPGDMVIDAGNADFNDTIRRSTELARAGIEFVGMGVSGGENGARHGPSMMVGGSENAWTRMAPVMRAIAARFGDDPCVAHLGPDGAGHFVKTVHNGIEYADMQMIAEVYGLLRDGAGYTARRAADLFGQWNDGPLESFLIDVTGKVLAAKDPATGAAMVEVIQDRAGQKGTGRWTVIEALKLGQSATAIEAAVAARSWSSDKDSRVIAASLLGGPQAPDRDGFPAVEFLERALLAGRILAHAQGFDVLRAASDEFGWALDLARIAEIWRAGCIIRSALLDDLATALRHNPEHGGMVLSPRIRAMLDETVPALRQIVGWAVAAGLPVPSLCASVQWYDAIRQARGTANLIQAQRDFFGAHGFERTDQPGRHHGDWTQQE